MCKRSSVRRRGFSLIELVVALAAFMVLCVGGAYIFDGVQCITTRAELALLALTLKAEQQKALVTATKRTTILDNDGLGYYTQSNRHRFQRGIMYAAAAGAYGPPASPTKPVTKAVTFAGNTITCYPTGAMNAGTIYLGAPSLNQYYALTNSVAHNSFLRLYKYRLNWIPL